MNAPTDFDTLLAAVRHDLRNPVGHVLGYGEMLEHLGLASGYVVGRQALPGPNWKLAYDGYLDYYHLPTLHKKTFGPEMSSEALYDAWGPHQRVTAPDRHFETLANKPEESWQLDELIGLTATTLPAADLTAFINASFGDGQTSAAVRERDRRPEGSGFSLMVEMLIDRGGSGRIASAGGNETARMIALKAPNVAAEKLTSAAVSATSYVNR